MLYILFGLSGAGKNYVGGLLQDVFGCHFWDGDEALTADMHGCIARRELFTQDMIDVFCEVMADRIEELQEQTQKPIVVAQALYRESNRRQLAQRFPFATFVHISVTPAIIRQRLLKRIDGVDLAYAEQNQSYFEFPQLSHITLLNHAEGREDLQRQIEHLLGLRSLEVEGASS